MSSKPTTPIAQRRYAESETSRIPISLSPIPFRRTYSMRLRTNCLLNETTLKEHNRNIQQSRAIVDRNQRHLKLNLGYNRRGSLQMDAKLDSNGVDTGGTDEVDRSPCPKHLPNGILRRSSFTNKIDRNGMVSYVKSNWTRARCTFDSNKKSKIHASSHLVEFLLLLLDPAIVLCNSIHSRGQRRRTHVRTSWLVTQIYRFSLHRKLYGRFGTIVRAESIRKKFFSLSLSTSNFCVFRF